MPMGTLAVGFLAFALQLTFDSPTRLGEIAARFSADDIAQLERLLGERPWLLIGHPSALSNDWWVECYGTPATTDGTLRRGAVIVAWTDPRQSSPKVPGANQEPAAPRVWRTDRTVRMSWAQVALPGRTLDDFRGERDANRPFRVVGDFGDAELVRLVEFVRSGPQLADVNRTRIVNRTLPIAYIGRGPADGLIEIRLPISEWWQQHVVVRAAGEAWSVVGIYEAH